MSYNDKDLPRTKVAIRGKTLVVWLPEATPPVLWRFVAENMSGGFSLRHGEGKVDLVHNDGSAQPQIIASFTSESSAERALSRLSRAILSYKSGWRKVLKIATIIFVIYLMLSLLTGGLRLLSQYHAIRTATAQAQGSDTARTSAQAPSVPLMLPGMAPSGSVPAKPPTGVPLDVDKLSR